MQYNSRPGVINWQCIDNDLTIKFQFLSGKAQKYFMSSVSVSDDIKKYRLSGIKNRFAKNKFDPKCVYTLKYIICSEN